MYLYTNYLCPSAEFCTWISTSTEALHKSSCRGPFSCQRCLYGGMIYSITLLSFQSSVLVILNCAITIVLPQHDTSTEPNSYLYVFVVC